MSQITNSSSGSGGGAVDSVTGDNGVVASPTTGDVIVSGIQATTTQIGVNTNATEEQVTFGTYGTTQAVTAENIVPMLSSPPPIGDTASNLGFFTALSSTAGQNFSNAVNTFPSSAITVKANTGYDFTCVATRSFVQADIPGNILPGFGCTDEWFSQDTDGNPIALGTVRSVIDDATPGSNKSHVDIACYDTITPKVSLQSYPNFSRQPQGQVANYTSPLSYPYTVLESDYGVGVNTSSSAVTINLPSSPVTGQIWKIKDASANALVNNITIDGNGHNIVGTASASTYVISVSGAAVEIQYNGSVFLIY